MWSQSAPDNRLRLAARVPPPPSLPSDSDGSDSTAWGAPAPGAPGDSSACLLQPRSRTASMSTTSSSLSIAVTNGSASSPTAASPRLPDGADEIGFDERQYTRRGYELCPGCIETHGIVHAKAAAKGKSRDQHGRRVRGFRHTFREKIWGAGKWVDVEYAEDSECTICRASLMHNRFKCELQGAGFQLTTGVSCSKFDLCRSCYQKVEEIHPVHAFLSLPDKHVVPAPPRVAETRPPRHNGAFCHK